MAEYFCLGNIDIFYRDPCIGIITWIIRRLAKIKDQPERHCVSLSLALARRLFCFIAKIISVEGISGL
jgi:hypothetical protein